MKYFSIDELCRSNVAAARGINNRPDTSATVALHRLADNVLDPLRERWGGPITVTSGYRSPALNRAVGGSVTSQHLKGEAADITVGSREGNMRLFRLIRSMGLPFDQLIFEKGNINIGPDWVHVSFSSTRRRGEVLRYLGGGRYIRMS